MIGARLGLAAVLAAALAACAPPSDPCASADRSVNLGNLLSNSLAGSYDACVEELRIELAETRLRARAYDARALELSEEARRLEGERAEAALRLAAVNERQAEAARALSSAQTDREVGQAELERLLDEERRLAAELEALENRAGGPTEAEEAEIAAEQERLQQAIDDFVSGF